MRWLVCSAVLLCCAGEALSSPIRRFPYEAAVEGNEVFARSGPGRNYYPTAKLQQGTRVTVHRHDPGGWYMIAPPAGSFSWIRASYVKQETPGRGVLTSNDVIVRVGSVFGDDRDVEQVRLSTGEQVEILGENRFTSPRGVVHMYKIAPPRGEYRWVRGRSLVALDDSVRKANDRDPYAVPSNVVREVKKTTDHRGQLVFGAGPKLGSPHGHDHEHDGPKLMTHDHAGSHLPDHERLADLDRRFRTMCRQETASWDFAAIEKEYCDLQKSSTNPYVSQQIGRRLPTIKHYRSVKAEFDKLIRLTAETQRRDAELAGMTTHAIATGSQPGMPHHHHHEGSHEDGPSLGQPQPAILPAPGPQPSTPPIHAPGLHPAPSVFQPPVQQHRPHTMTPQQPARQFDGAGIVKRVQQVRPGLPRYAIVAPDGRFLAFLQPVRGITLEAYVGRAMGVYGKRFHRRDLGGDFIVVNAMQPVRLRP